MLKAANNNRFAHILCLNYIDVFNNVVVDSGELLIDEIPAQYKELKCKYCLKKNGACAQCRRKKCERAFHPFCAYKNGALLLQRGEKNLQFSKL